MGTGSEQVGAGKDVAIQVGQSESKEFVSVLSTY